MKLKIDNVNVIRRITISEYQQFYLVEARRQRTAVYVIYTLVALVLILVYVAMVTYG